MMHLRDQFMMSVAGAAYEAAAARGNGPGYTAETAAEWASMFAGEAFKQSDTDLDYDESREMRAERLQVATQLAAALMPHMLHHTPREVSQRALEIADTLIDMVDYRA